MNEKPSAFIVEDDPQLNRLFGVTLQNDFDLLQLHDGEEALRALRSRVPTLIVLDMNLPGASGAKILQYVRGDERFAVTRVILVTADANQAAALEQQADLALLKPVSPMQLRDLASRVAGKTET